MSISGISSGLFRTFTHQEEETSVGTINSKEHLPLWDRYCELLANGKVEEAEKKLVEYKELRQELIRREQQAAEREKEEARINAQKNEESRDEPPL
ncbi:MAG TPA: hypothetical protein VLE96_05690 [Chlamydiales bacterium]|nr:hypothetical protein [Chlamydiales bacterium]